MEKSPTLKVGVNSLTGYVGLFPANRIKRLFSKSLSAISSMKYKEAIIATFGVLGGVFAKSKIAQLSPPTKQKSRLYRLHNSYGPDKSERLGSGFPRAVGLKKEP